MTNKRIAKHPLLYIDQPTVNAPKASMQSTYQSSKNKKVKPVTQKGEPQPIRARPKHVQRKRPSVDDEKENKSNIINQIEQREDSSEKETSSLKFKEMSIQQKINYFSNVPTHIPKLKCEIKTGEKSFRGIITNHDDESVFLRTGNRIKPTTIFIKDIKDIRMLGF